MKIHEIHTIILGSGAAGLNAAVQLKRRGVNDLLILSEGLEMGTSINTGSDKQTYYKLGLYGGIPDSPEDMARTLFDGGAMDGDTALVEAALSARAFYNLCELGVSFPQDAWGQYPGYKTDHDPRQRATSIGPYTSRVMCLALTAEVQRLGIPVRENRVAIKLLCVGENGAKRIAGLFCVDTTSGVEECLELYLCENLVFATGGPGGLYRDSVYPTVHTGAIGLTFEIGATAQNLPEAQFGLASTAFRWNVSGSYMQVIPRFVSCAKTDEFDPQEFLDEYFDTPTQRDTAVFLKGYQWPFDVRKIHGSSLIDLAVYRETVERDRCVFLDYCNNSSQFDFGTLPDEVRDYLEKSGAVDQSTLQSPIRRLIKMNAPAVELYRDHDIDLANEPLEIAVCAQHDNGGLAVGPFWESVNIAHLFVAGEVAGTHGVARPGGSALNSGQVAGFRIAEYISGRYQSKTLDCDAIKHVAQPLFETLKNGGLPDWRTPRLRMQSYMSDTVGPIVKGTEFNEDVLFQSDVWNEFCQIARSGAKVTHAVDLAESFRTRSLALASWVYFSAIMCHCKVGSRGSRIVLDDAGIPVCEQIPWTFLAEDEQYREQIQETKIEIVTSPTGEAAFELLHGYRLRRPIPESDAWFETAWAAFRNGEHLR